MTPLTRDQRRVLLAVAMGHVHRLRPIDWEWHGARATYHMPNGADVTRLVRALTAKQLVAWTHGRLELTRPMPDYSDDGKTPSYGS